MTVYVNVNEGSAILEIEILELIKTLPMVGLSMEKDIALVKDYVLVISAHVLIILVLKI